MQHTFLQCCATGLYNTIYGRSEWLHNDSLSGNGGTIILFSHIWIVINNFFLKLVIFFNFKQINLFKSLQNIPKKEAKFVYKCPSYNIKRTHYIINKYL